MSDQLEVFAAPRTWPDGLKYEANLLTAEHESLLLEEIRQLPFREFAFHGHTGKRRTISFGWTYDFDQEQLQPAAPIPEFLIAAQQIAAAFAGLEPAALVQALVIEYESGAGIGWHRDKSVFGEVVGVSLLSPCVLRFRKKVDGKWDRVNVRAEPRSARDDRGHLPRRPDAQR